MLMVVVQATGNYYALKMLSKSLCIRTKQSEHIIAERNILTEIKVRHMLPLPLHEATPIKTPSSSTIKTPNPSCF